MIIDSINNITFDTNKCYEYRYIKNQTRIQLALEHDIAHGVNIV